MIIVSQNKEMMVNNYDFIDIEECAATELDPSLVVHIGDVSRKIATYKNREDAAAVLTALADKMFRDVINLPTDSKDAVNRFTRNTFSM